MCDPTTATGAINSQSNGIASSYSSSSSSLSSSMAPSKNKEQSRMANDDNNSSRCLAFALRTTTTSPGGKNKCTHEGQGPQCLQCQKKYSLKCILYPSFYFGKPTIMKCLFAFFTFAFTMAGLTTVISKSNINANLINAHQHGGIHEVFASLTTAASTASTASEGGAFASHGFGLRVLQLQHKLADIFPKFSNLKRFRNLHDTVSSSSSSSSSAPHSPESAHTQQTDEEGSYSSNEYSNTCHANDSSSSCAYSFEDYFHDEDALYLSEADYILLQNITTQIGSFEPLPSTLVSTLTTKTTTATTTTPMPVRTMAKPKRFIPILEARGSSQRDIDKNEHGHRRDTIPIANAIDSYYEQQEDQKVQSAVFQFMEEYEDNGIDINQHAVQSNLALKEYLRSIAHGVVVRINPGTLSPLSTKKCDDMLRELSKDGLVILSHPDVSSTLGAKDSLVKIRDLKCGMDDTEVYYTPEAFHEGFRRRISYEPRVIKQNRGCQGEGVWIAKLKDESAYCKKGEEECMVSLDAELELMEAFDNHIEYHTVRDFIDFCSLGRSGMEDSSSWTTKSNGKYFDGGLEAGAMVVDQRFLPRIVEGEVRCLMVGSELVEIVHKKPKEGGLSATLESGATYTKYPPDHPKFAKLVNNFKQDVPRIMESFGMSDQPLPLLWTVDYIYGETDDDLYAGEINCSCPGITQQLHIVPTIARVAFETVFGDNR